MGCRHCAQDWFDFRPGNIFLLLGAALENAGIAYVHLKKLGGLRHGTGPSPNTGWRYPRFRAYADYMQTDEFDRGLARLEELAAANRTVVMCAEGLPWRCHRSLISDALMARGWQVEEIMPDSKVRPHPMTGFALIDDGRVSYPDKREDGAGNGMDTLW